MYLLQTPETIVNRAELGNSAGSRIRTIFHSVTSQPAILSEVTIATSLSYTTYHHTEVAQQNIKRCMVSWWPFEPFGLNGCRHLVFKCTFTNTANLLQCRDAARHRTIRQWRCRTVTRQTAPHHRHGPTPVMVFVRFFRKHRCVVQTACVYDQTDV